MKYILFDTNVYLALIFPLDIWKTIVEEPLEEALVLVKKGNIKIVCPDEVFYEVDRRIGWISEQFNKEFSLIYDEIKELKGIFDKDNILKFRKVMELKIFNEKESVDRNRLFFIEGLILKEMKENPRFQINEVLQNCIEFFNEINTRLIGEFANYNRKYKIDRLVFAQNNEEEQEYSEINEEIKKSVKKDSDAKILSVFIYFLRKENAEGIMVTHDFEHLLLNSLALEAIFPEILIVRPGYVKCLINPLTTNAFDS